MRKAAASAATIGRPTKCTPQLRDAIVLAIKAGNYAQVAAVHAGIAPSTYFKWMASGKSGQAPYKEFMDAIHAAEAFAETRAMAIVSSAMSGDWKAAAWYLERKFQDRWSRYERHEVSGSLPMKIVHVHRPAKG